jgi:hypothetical protein
VSEQEVELARSWTSITFTLPPGGPKSVAAVQAGCAAADLRQTSGSRLARGLVMKLGKMVKHDCICPQVSFGLEDGWRIVVRRAKENNKMRFPIGIGYTAPQDRLRGRGQAIRAVRPRKLAQARLARPTAHGARMAMLPTAMSRSPPVGLGTVRSVPGLSYRHKA